MIGAGDRRLATGDCKQGGENPPVFTLFSLLEREGRNKTGAGGAGGMSETENSSTYTTFICNLVVEMMDGSRSPGQGVAG